ncbi:DUF2780 domain-containing protein [Pseudomonas sp. Pseusp122]|uniref:DUF2780 domain-containing protein n=1 Tax=unclassified Pseudomonas TaxID=196821 RepID=UPI0039A61743
MKISQGIVLAILMTLSATPAFAFNLNDAANAVSGATGNSQQATQATGLITTLGNNLNVTPQQAVGGTRALLGLAKNKLSGNDYSQLSQYVPGLDQLTGAGALGGLGGILGNSGGSAAGNVKSMADVNKTFSALGMDSSMVGQFVPVILEYLGGQGVGGSTLKNLGSIWGAGS